MSWKKISDATSYAESLLVGDRVRLRGLAEADLPILESWWFDPAVQVFQTQHGTDWPLLMAASVLVAAPLVVLYFVAQRKFIEGITLTGLKG